MLRHNFLARKHPVNVLRRDQLHAEIVREYKPSTLELRDACRFLANVKERLERTKDGTPEHQRLMTMWSDLSTQLRTASRDLTAAGAGDLANLTTAQLADRAEAMAKHLRDTANAEAASAAHIARAAEEHRAAAGLHATRAEGSAQEPQASTTEPAPEARCDYCGQLASHCATIRDDPSWLGEHLARADVQAHLATQAERRRQLGWDAVTGRDPITRGVSSAADDPTAVMMHQIGKPPPA